MYLSNKKKDYFSSVKNLSNIGRIFYGIAILEMGLQGIFCKKFPYMLTPPNHFPMTILATLAYISGTLLALAGICIVLNRKIRPAALLLGFALLLIFCFYFIPYQFITNTYMNFGDWENAEKELALCGGAFIITGCFPGKNETPFIRFLPKLIPLGAIFFSLPIICFGIDHFIGPLDVADYTPDWVPFKLFWAYFCGAALIGSGIAIIFKIKLKIIAALLGVMIFCWFTMLHIPRVIVSPAKYLGSEITSSVIALAYSGIAFVIAGAAKNSIIPTEDT
jgi:uncharacterized membrane protein YphA (DoxX/SURF4 family)